MADDTGEVAHHRLLGDHHPARETCAAGGILNISQLAGRQGMRQGTALRILLEFVGIAHKGQPQPHRSLLQERQKTTGGDGYRGLAAFHHHPQLLHIGLMTTQADGNRQRHRHQAGILAGKEEAQKIGVSLGDQRYPRAPFETQARETTGQGQRLFPQLRVGDHGIHLPSTGVEIAPCNTLSRIIQCFRKIGKIRRTKRQRICGRCGIQIQIIDLLAYLLLVQSLARMENCGKYTRNIQPYQALKIKTFQPAEFLCHHIKGSHSIIYREYIEPI